MKIYKVSYELYDKEFQQWIKKSRDDIYYIEITAGEMLIKNIFGGEDIIYLKKQENYHVFYSKVRNIEIEELKEGKENEKDIQKD